MTRKTTAHKTQIRQERGLLLEHYIQRTDKPMVGLALVWIGLMIADSWAN